MIAVADTSPVSYLVLIGEIELLPALFAEVVIPPGVAAELSDPRGPLAVRDWWRQPPPWIRVDDPGPEPPPEEVRRLHQGEREAILLAQRIGADVVLIDEKAGRRAAKKLGLSEVPPPWAQAAPQRPSCKALLDRGRRIP